MQNNVTRQELPRLNDLDHERVGILAMRAGPWFNVEDDFMKLWRTKDERSIGITVFNLINCGYIRRADRPIVYNEYKLEDDNVVVYTNRVKNTEFYEFTDVRLKNFINTLQKKKAWKRPAVEEEKEGE